MVLNALAVLIVSWLAAIVVNVLTAILMELAGYTMTWFTHSLLLLPLYIAPSLVAMAHVHSFWQKKVRSIKALNISRRQ